MRCFACGAEMCLVQVAALDDLVFPGFEHNIFECSGCDEIERRLVFSRPGEPRPTDRVPVKQPSRAFPMSVKSNPSELFSASAGPAAEAMPTDDDFALLQHVYAMLRRGLPDPAALGRAEVAPAENARAQAETTRTETARFAPAADGAPRIAATPNGSGRIEAARLDVARMRIETAKIRAARIEAARIQPIGTGRNGTATIETANDETASTTVSSMQAGAQIDSLVEIDAAIEEADHVLLMRACEMLRAVPRRDKTLAANPGL